MTRIAGPCLPGVALALSLSLSLSLSLAPVLAYGQDGQLQTGPKVTAPETNENLVVPANVPTNETGRPPNASRAGGFSPP